MQKYNSIKENITASGNNYQTYSNAVISPMHLPPSFSNSSIVIGGAPDIFAVPSIITVKTKILSYLVQNVNV